MTTNKIYVFESNIEGRHVKGNALRAYKKHGAEYGIGYGMQGNSFAIPVLDEEFNPMPLSRIQKFVESFIKYAKLNPQYTFEVTRIGCGHTYEDSDIAPFFSTAPQNCLLPAGWRVFSQRDN